MKKYNTTMYAGLNGYEGLAYAIILHAIEDYECLLDGDVLTVGNGMAPVTRYRNYIELLKFFKSDYFKIVRFNVAIDGEKIIEILNSKHPRSQIVRKINKGIELTVDDFKIRR